MNYSSLLLLVSLAFCSCGKAPSGTPETASPAPQAHTSAPAASQTPAISNSLPRLKPTDNQLGSVLRLRIGFGGLPPRDTIGALLHRSEIPDEFLTETKTRFLLASVKGWDESQLRSPSTHIIVYRNKVNARGEIAATSTPGFLLQFDATTGCGVIGYQEDFDYVDDVGFHLERNNGVHSEALLLRTSRETSSSDARMNDLRIPPNKPFPYRPIRQDTSFYIDSGVYRETKGKPVTVEMPTLAPGQAADPTLLALSPSGALTGFVEGTPEGIYALAPLDRFSIAIKKCEIIPTRVVFGTDNQVVIGSTQFSQLRMMIFAEAAKGDVMPRHIWIRKCEIPLKSEDKPPQTKPDGSYPPISSDAVELSRSFGIQGSLSILLDPPPPNQEKLYRMQLSWPLMSSGTSPQVSGKPFLVKISGRVSGTYPTVIGLPTPDRTEYGKNTAATELQHRSEFPLEAPAKNIHMVAGGRGALIQLERKPYWKLFSFDGNAWLPIPGDLSNVHITGNLTSLYILDRDTCEVRKFKLPGLEPDGSTKLPRDQYYAILAGCNSEYSALHILTANEELTLDPGTLQQQVRHELRGNQQHLGANGEYYGFSISGDGLSFSSLSKNCSESDVFGLSAGYERGNRIRCPGGKEIPESDPPQQDWRYQEVSLSENAPVVFRVKRYYREVVPPAYPRLSLFSFSNPHPIAEMEVPEFAEISPIQGETNRRRWAFFDPYSLQIATLNAERNVWYVHKPVIDNDPARPSLLNWPDTSVPPQEAFRFRPVLTSGSNFTFEVLGNAGLAKTNSTGEIIEFTSPANQIDNQLLTLRIPGMGGPGASYPIQIRTAGPQQPLAALPAIKPETINVRGSNLEPPGTSTHGLAPLAATFHQFQDPIKSIAGTAAGYAVLITDTDRIDFFSLNSRRIAGSYTPPKGASFYFGAGAMYEFDPGKHTLTRIAIPGAKCERVLNIPSFVQLQGIGIGTEKESPLTLAVNIPAKTVGQFADLRINTTADTSVLINLDACTFLAGTRYQPVKLEEIFKNQATKTDGWGGFLSNSNGPAILPSSHSGLMVNLPRYFLAIGANFSIAYPCDRSGIGLDLNSSTPGRAGGSVSGLMAFSESGRTFKGETAIAETQNSLGGICSNLGPTPCGRYRIKGIQEGQAMSLEIRLAETDVPLLRVGRIAELGSISFSNSERRAAMLGDNGPLAILSRSGKTMEVIDLDISSIMRSLAPDEFHVISQPVPWVVGGSMFRYQIQVNNPSAVESYKLRNTIPGATVSPQGLVSFSAPVMNTTPMHVTISIEIVGKNHKTTLHEFPVYILPNLRTGPKTRIGEF